MISRAPLVLDSEMLDEARTFLRLEEADLDPSLGGVILSAVAAAEDFLNLMLLRRSVTETMAASTGWLRLGTAPVTAISAVELVDPSGTAVPVAPGDHAIDIDGSGAGWVRIVHPPPRAHPHRLYGRDGDGVERSAGGDPPRRASTCRLCFRPSRRRRRSRPARVGDCPSQALAAHPPFLKGLT